MSMAYFSSTHDWQAFIQRSLPIPKYGGIRIGWYSNSCIFKTFTEVTPPLGSRAFSVWVRVPSGAPKRTTMTKSHGGPFYTSFIQMEKRTKRGMASGHPPLLHDSEKLKRASSWRRPWRPRSRCPEPSAHRGCGRPPRSPWTSWPRSAA